jgi:predicted dehydrogenase
MLLRLLSLVTLLVAVAAAQPQNGAPVRLAIAGLTHGHVDGFLRAIQGRKDVQLVGVYDADAALRQSYARKFGLPDSLLFANLEAMLAAAKPEAVAAFTSTFDHPAIVEAAAKAHIAVMMEKPLAVSVADARRIERAASDSGIPVIVNYETTWYPSHGEIWKLIKTEHAAGDIRKMVAMDGHEGPKEIGVGPEFLGWLTDPEKNGAGALFDFGCYGANLMTWLMDNQRPAAVTAMLQQIKPQIYPHVDDEATVLVEYPKAQGIIQASWNWPFGRKDLEVYGATGYAIATGGNSLRTRFSSGQEHAITPAPLPAADRDSVSYLVSIVRGGRKPSGLSSLANNMIVTEILEAARESARTGKRITLGGTAIQ